MFGFLKSDRKLLGETVKQGLKPEGGYPKTKSIFQNLKFRANPLPVHIYERKVKFFERTTAEPRLNRVCP